MKEFEKDLADGEEAGTVAEGTSTPSANGAHTSLNNPPPAPWGAEAPRVRGRPRRAARGAVRRGQPRIVVKAKPAQRTWERTIPGQRAWGCSSKVALAVSPAPVTALARTPASEELHGRHHGIDVSGRNPGESGAKPAFRSRMLARG